MPVTYFVIIGMNDSALFEWPEAPESQHSQQATWQFIVHAAVDMVEERMWLDPNFALMKVDRSDERYYVSSYVGFTPVKLMLMQDCEPHDNVRPFFFEAHELCLKYFLSPFSDPSVPIRSPEFEERMKMIYHRYF